MRVFKILVLIGCVCIFAVAAIAVVISVDVAASQDGDAIAEKRVVATADAFTSAFGYQTEVTDAESIAGERFRSTSTEVQPVRWSGSTEAGDEAIIDIRIRSDVEAKRSQEVFGPWNSAGTVERCYRFTLTLYAEVQREEIDCDELPQSVPAPTATPKPALPADTAEMMEAVLLQSDAQSASDELRDAFPEVDVTVEVTSTADGELVAAVGIAAVRDCVVMVRDADGVVFRASFDRISLEPGELGCSVRLYTAPFL
ncbi:hypothetical protein [Microbacterium sp. A84]|uniref:hypothetical protein n=1 Tax=Microbacterium sp. A84 TaxID=3450715 RepID=UPI003F42B42D